MAPEQANGVIDQIDSRSDVFGLGAILCEILTGQPPYVAGSSTDALLLAALGDLDSASVRLQSSGVDPELVQLALACLAVKREDRPPDGEAVAQAITAYQASVADRLRRAELELAQAEARAGEERKRRHLVVANQRLAVRGKVKAPALCLGLIGILSALNALFFFGIVLIGHTGGFSEEASKPREKLPAEAVIFFAGMAILWLAVSLLFLVGAVKLQKLQSYGWVLTSSIVCLIPCLSPSWIFSFPIGIWVLTILTREDVKQLFREAKPGRTSQPAGKGDGG